MPDLFKPKGRSLTYTLLVGLKQIDHITESYILFCVGVLVQYEYFIVEYSIDMNRMLVLWEHT